jgi:hypothetical protein
MGNNYTKDKFESEKISCTDDLMCQNINSSKSEPGKPIVLTCPTAKCVFGTCECGSKCKRDPYTGMCCKDVITEVKNGNVDTYCIENFSNIPCSSFQTT